MTAIDFNEYRRIVTGLINQAPNGSTQTAALDALMAVARLMLDDEPAAYPTLIKGLDELAKGKPIDGLPKRPAYPLLALHVHLAAFGKRYLMLPDSIWENATEQFEKLAAPLRTIEAYRRTPPPHMSTEIVLWQAWNLLQIGSLRHADSDIELARDVIWQIIDRPVTDKALTEQDPEESLDGWTYRELVAMHALSNAALHDRNEAWADRLEQIAVYHLNVTQPDHCTSEPWGLFGFLWSDQSRMFGIQQIHDVKAYGLVGVGRILLADAARCLGEFAD